VSAEDRTVEPGWVSSRPLHQGRIVDLRIDTVRFPDGSLREMEMIRHSGAAAVLPLLDPRDTADPLVLLVRQYRYAGGGFILEVPAGRPDAPGEPWERCAARELEEETGLVPGRLTRLTSILTTPGFTDERIHLFLAEDLRPGTQNRDADEFLELVRLPLSEALELVRREEIVDGKTICTLLYAAGFLLG
jgi:ADP-ribose pyrophosphatase